MTKLLVALAFLGVNLYVYNYFANEEVIPPRSSFTEFPLDLDGWVCDKREPMESRVEQNLGVTDYLICNYARRDPDALVSVYVGYHETQVRREGGGAGENSIHPPKHCLPGSGWSIVEHEVVPLSLPGLPRDSANVNQLVIAKGNQRQLVYYWYQSRGRVIAHDWTKIVALMWDRATRQRTDGSLVRFTVPILRDDRERADRAFRELAERLVPKLGPYVPS